MGGSWTALNTLLTFLGTTESSSDSKHGLASAGCLFGEPWVNSLRLRCAVPVHGELCHQSDVGVVRTGLVLVVEEVQVGSVNGEALSTELVTGIVLVQLQQGFLELHKEKTQTTVLESVHNPHEVQATPALEGLDPF